VKCVMPKQWWHRGISKESSDEVVDGSYLTFNFVVFWKGI